MAAELPEVLEQSLQAVHVFARHPFYADGRPVVKSILRCLRRGMRRPLCIFNSGHAAMFFGAGGQLYCLGKAPGENEELQNPQVLLLAGGAGLHDGSTPLPEEGFDATGAQVERCGANVLVVTAEQELFTVPISNATPPLRRLPDIPIAQVACGRDHFLALSTHGDVYSYGRGTSGQLGMGALASSTELQKVPIHIEDRPRFAIRVACGAVHSIVLCQDEAFGFGLNRNKQCCDSEEATVCTPAPMNLLGNLWPRTCACGAHHTLILASYAGCPGRLLGRGNGSLHQLGPAGCGNHNLRAISLSDSVGTPVDVYCHSDLSVIYTSLDKFYICGQADSVFGIPCSLMDFVLLRDDYIFLDNVLVCARPARATRIPGFGDPDSKVCDVRVSATRDPSSPPIYIGSQAIHKRSPYLSRLLSSPCKRGVEEDGGERRILVNLHNYSYEAILAYCKYLYMDEVDCEPSTAAELLGLAQEYGDEGGLTEQCARCLQRGLALVTSSKPEALPQAVEACVKFGYTSLAAELVKRAQNPGNVCATLHAVESLPSAQPAAGSSQRAASTQGMDYISKLLFRFAMENATAVATSTEHNKDIMSLGVKAKLLTMLAYEGLLGT